jgi:hypothetical protein
MTDIYPIYEVRNTAVSPAAAHVVSGDRLHEQMGSKRKFWLCDSSTSRWYLFKYSRPNTGEHWSEKVPCEVASLLGLPHARVELATCEGAAGVLVEDLRPEREAMSLLHGNELLVELDPAYPSQRDYRVSEHTVERVERALREHNVGLPNSSALVQALPTAIDDSFGLFVGYLLLDAIVGNTDRHHENWGVVATRSAAGSRILQLAPTYDHASSLGRELDDAKRSERLRESGSRGVPGYMERARSALYGAPGDNRPLSPRAAFHQAGILRPNARDAWLQRCAQLGLLGLERPLSLLPPASVSETAATFAKAMIRYSWTKLFDCPSESAR